MKNFVLIGLFLLTHSLLAQEYQKAQTVQLINHKIIIPDDGTLDEALSLTQDWTENVLRQNENIDEVRLLISDSEKDTIDLVVLYRFKAEVIRSTNEINKDLISKRWPESEDFKSFMQKLHRYIDPKMNEKSLYKELVLQ